MLTEKQKRFIDEYMVDLNGTQAAIRAGYSARTARAIASETLKKPAVAAKIADRKRRRNQKTLAEEFKVLQGLWRVALADPQDLFDAEGNVRPPEQWSDEARHCVSNFRIRETFAEAPGGRKKLVRRVTNLRVRHLKDKVKALIYLHQRFAPVQPEERPSSKVMVVTTSMPWELRERYPDAHDEVFESRSKFEAELEENLRLMDREAFEAFKEKAWDEQLRLEAKLQAKRKDEKERAWRSRRATFDIETGRWVYKKRSGNQTG